MAGRETNRHQGLRRRYFATFGIRTAFLLTTFVAISLAWYVSNRNAWAHEQQILSKLRTIYPGGWGYLNVVHSECNLLHSCIPSNDAHTEPTWFGNRIGANFYPDIFERIHLIVFECQNSRSNALTSFAEFPYLREIVFFEGTFSNEALAEFSRLRPDVRIKSIDRSKLSSAKE